LTAFAAAPASTCHHRLSISPRRDPLGSCRDPWPAARTLPTVVRIAIVSRADEFDRRVELRTLVLADAPSHDVAFVHRFIVGREAGWFR
jgi:hypothetical protein